MRLFISFTIFIVLFAFSSIMCQAGGFGLEVRKVASGVWVHTSHKDLNGLVFPSNGLIIETDSGIVFVDTAWDPDQTLQLIKWVDDSLPGRKVLFCIVTHSHDDRRGGIREMLAAGIPVWSTALTASLSMLDSLPAPDPVLPDDTTINLGKTSIQCWYPGPGHAPDNIVVWLPGQKLLFGGCMIKSYVAKGIGNTADADMALWPKNVRKVSKRYSGAKIIVPGHEAWGGKACFSRTLELLKQ